MAKRFLSKSCANEKKALNRYPLKAFLVLLPPAGRLSNQLVEDLLAIADLPE